MRKLFTKNFSAATVADQRQIAASRLRDLAQAVPSDDTGRVKSMIRRVEIKAVEYGLCQDKEALLE